jgi:polyhydroxyalkanoic acid synthase PhaR subunit
MAEKPENVPTPADFFGWMNQMMTMPVKAMSDMLPQGTTTDPLEFWKNVSQRNEEIWGKFLQQLVGTPDFARNLGQTAGASAWYRNAVKQTARMYLEAADMPTREDVVRLGEMLVNIEGKIEELNESVVNLEDELDETEDSLEELSVTLKDVAKTKDVMSLAIPNEPPAELLSALAAQDKELKSLKAAFEANAKEPTQLGKVVALLENIGDRLGKIEARLDKLETVKAETNDAEEPKTATPKPPKPGVKKKTETED